MQIDQVELRVVRLPYRSVFKTSFAAETEKHAIITTVRSDGVEGYGEGVMDPLPSYREESITGALHLLRDALVPFLLAKGCDDPLTLCDAWDCHARRLGVPLRTLIGGERTEIPVGASLGMNPVPETVESVRRHIEQGYQRVKLKIEPGWDINILSAVRAEFPDIELTVDANSAYTLDDLDVLKQIDGFGLHYIEQPLHWDDLVDHAALSPQLRTISRPAQWSISRSGASVGWPPPGESTTCASSETCRCGAGACSRPASAVLTTFTSRRCPASSTPATQPQPAERMPVTSLNRRWRPPMVSCPFQLGPALASPSIGSSSTR
jgi:hypothetical protein